MTAGRLVVVRSNVAVTAIKLRNRLRFFLGEWFLDTRLGAPYRQYLFVKNPNLAVARQVIRKIIEGTPGVAELLSLDATLDAKARKLTWTFRARCLSGEVLSGTNAELPYVVEV